MPDIAPTLSAQLGEVLRESRRRRGLSIEQLAASELVSPRLVSELERGVRPHASLETTLRLLGAVGVHVDLVMPENITQRIDNEATEQVARAARAEHRRKTWPWRKSKLGDEERDTAALSPAERMAAVVQASITANELNAAKRRRA